MQLKLPRPRRFLSTQSRVPSEPSRPEDDPWAGEDAEWEAEPRRPRDDPAALVRFFRALAVWALVGGLFWAGVVLLVVWLL